MNKFWKIVAYEYSRHVFRKRFIFALLSLPLFALLIIGVALLVGFFSTNTTPYGYVDHSGVLANAAPINAGGSIFDRNISMIVYEDEKDAAAALEAEIIQTYFVLPEDYETTLKIQQYFSKMPDSQVLSQFRRHLRDTMLKNEDLPNQARILEGTTFTLESADGAQSMRDDQWYNIFVPFVAGLLFFVVVMTSGGYLLQAVVDEKENRTMEIIITSVTPMQLMAGKIVGNISVGLTQLLIWMIFGWATVAIGGRYMPVLGQINISLNFVLVLVLTLIPAFVMVAAIMAAIGATVTESREAQQVSGFFSMPIMIPYWFASIIMLNPNGAVATALSFFPLTAPVTLTMRMAFTTVPFWQIALIIVILIVFAVLAIWLAARAFRIGMLQYGKRLAWRQIFSKEASK